MAVRQIPRRLLPHSCIYRAYTGTNTRNVAAYAADVPMKFVRFEPTKKTVVNNLGEGKGDKFLMYIDKVNSYPTDIAFKNLDQIEFKGAKLTIRVSEEIYADKDAIHHWEISLL